MNNYNYDPRIIVTLPSSDLRKIARDSLRGKWKTAAIGTLIYMTLLMAPQTFLNSMFSGMSGFASSLYSILLTGPFTFGYSLFMMNIFRNKEASYTQLFDGFENVLKTMLLYLYMMLFIMLWSLLFVIPGIIATLRYSQAFYILADNPEMSVPQAVNESKRIMNGNVFKLFCLNLSFIGWMILVSIPSGIAGGVLSTNIITQLAGNADLANMVVNAMESGVDPIAVMNMLLPSGNMLMYELLSYVLSIGYIFLNPYIEASTIAMYEIMQDNLRPKTRNFTVVQD